MSDAIETSGGPDLAAIANRLFPSSVPSAAPAEAARASTAAPEAAKPATAPQTPAAQVPDAMRARLADAASARTTEQTRIAAEKARPTDDASIANRVWGEKPEAAAKPELPDAVAELRNDPARRMFSADVFATAVDTKAAITAATNVVDLKATTGIDMTPEQLDAIMPVVVAELHAMYTDAGLTTDEADLVERVIVDVRTNKPDAATDAANANTTIGLLNERYGQGAAQALRDAQAFIARDPRIGKMMDMSRAGNDSRMVLLAVEAARRARSRGERF